MNTHLSYQEGGADKEGHSVFSEPESGGNDVAFAEREPWSQQVTTTDAKT